MTYKTQHVSKAEPDRLKAADEDIRSALRSRDTWADRQTFYYKLRHGGLKRPKKPFPGAADMNWPLADMMIEKIKPYYIQQVFASELLANFFSLKSAHLDLNQAASQWFDYRLRQRTNFETEIISAADYMLVHGKSLMKVRWDEDRKRVAFDAVSPTMFIVPESTVELETADWCVQVHQLSEATYRRNSNYDQSICHMLLETNSTHIEDTEGELRDEKYLREGLTHGCDDSQIVLWEVYERQDDGTVEVFTFSPTLPDRYVRPPMALPYSHGAFPFIEFNAEIKDKGYYASRGIPERVASIQMSLSKLWNEKLDALTVYNRPFFYSDNPMVNAGNVRLTPGELIPFPIRKIPMESPPINWDLEMNSQRNTAEQMIGVPDDCQSGR